MNEVIHDDLNFLEQWICLELVDAPHAVPCPGRTIQGS